MEINRYEREQIKNQIDGYMISHQCFERAKAELISNLEKHLERVKSFDKSDFLKKTNNTHRTLRDEPNTAA